MCVSDRRRGRFEATYVDPRSTQRRYANSRLVDWVLNAPAVNVLFVVRTDWHPPIVLGVSGIARDKSRRLGLLADLGSSLPEFDWGHPCG